MKTGKILLSGAVVLAAGFAFAIPGIPTPVEKKAPSAPAVQLEANPWETEYSTDHAAKSDLNTKVAIVVTDGEAVKDTLYLKSDGTVAEELANGAMYDLQVNSKNTEYLLKVGNDYLQSAEITVYTDHVHTANSVDGTYCCGASTEAPCKSEKVTIVNYGTKPSTNIKFEKGDDGFYTLIFNSKKLSNEALAENEWTKELKGTSYDTSEYLGRLVFEGTEAAKIKFVTEAQLNYIADAQKAIDDHYADAEKYQGKHYAALMKLAKNADARNDWAKMSEEIAAECKAQDNAIAVLDAKMAAAKEMRSIKYQGTAYNNMVDLVAAVTEDTDATEFAKAYAALQADQKRATDNFSIEMTDSVYNLQKFKVTVVDEDINYVNLKVFGGDADNFVITGPKFGHELTIYGKADEDGHAVDAIYFWVERGAVNTLEEIWKKAIFKSNITAKVGLEVLSMPVKGYQQQIAWTVGSTLFSTDYDLVDGLLFFREGTKSLYFSTAGYDPNLTAEKPVAVLTHDILLKDFTITQPEFVKTVDEVTYWKVDVTYKPTAVLDNYEKFDASYVTAWLPYKDPMELDYPKTAQMPVKGCTYSLSVSEVEESGNTTTLTEVDQFNFPCTGMIQKFAINFKNYSGYLLYDKIMVVSSDPTAYNVWFTNKQNGIISGETANTNVFQGAGNSYITLQAYPRTETGVTDAEVIVYGLRNGKTVDEITRIPVTTTHPALAYGPNTEHKNFNISTETLTLGGDVKENYADEVEIKISDLKNYYDINDLKVQTNNSQFQLTNVSRFVVDKEGNGIITINVNYIPCTAHETASGQLIIQIAGTKQLITVNLVGKAGNDAVVAAVKGGATGINAVSADDAENGVSYNVAGQRVNANAKGLVIKNGKKYMVK